MSRIETQNDRLVRGPDPFQVRTNIDPVRIAPARKDTIRNLIASVNQAVGAVAKGVEKQNRQEKKLESEAFQEIFNSVLVKRNAARENEEAIPDYANALQYAVDNSDGANQQALLGLDTEGTLKTRAENQKLVVNNRIIDSISKIRVDFQDNLDLTDQSLIQMPQGNRVEHFTTELLDNIKKTSPDLHTKIINDDTLLQGTRNQARFLSDKYANQNSLFINQQSAEDDTSSMNGGVTTAIQEPSQYGELKSNYLTASDKQDQEASLDFAAHTIGKATTDIDSPEARVDFFTGIKDSLQDVGTPGTEGFVDNSIERAMYESAILATHKELGVQAAFDSEVIISDSRADITSKPVDTLQSVEDDLLQIFADTTGIVKTDINDILKDAGDNAELAQSLFTTFQRAQAELIKVNAQRGYDFLDVDFVVQNTPNLLDDEQSRVLLADSQHIALTGVVEVDDYNLSRSLMEDYLAVHKGNLILGDAPFASAAIEDLGSDRGFMHMLGMIDGSTKAGFNSLLGDKELSDADRFALKRFSDKYRSTGRDFSTLFTENPDAFVEGRDRLQKGFTEDRALAERYAKSVQGFSKVEKKSFETAMLSAVKQLGGTNLETLSPTARITLGLEFTREIMSDETLSDEGKVNLALNAIESRGLTLATDPSTGITRFIPSPASLDTYGIDTVQLKVDLNSTNESLTKKVVRTFQKVNIAGSKFIGNTSLSQTSAIIAGRSIAQTRNFSPAALLFIESHVSGAETGTNSIPLAIAQIMIDKKGWTNISANTIAQAFEKDLAYYAVDPEGRSHFSLDFRVTDSGISQLVVTGAKGSQSVRGADAIVLIDGVTPDMMVELSSLMGHTIVSLENDRKRKEIQDDPEHKRLIEEQRLQLLRGSKL